MALITYQNQQIEIAEPETVLEGLENAGFNVPFGCRSGLCHSCMMQATTQPPVSAQSGLSENQKAQHFFLACSCVPSGPMDVSLAESKDKLTGIITEKHLPNEQVVILKIQVDFTWHPGQAIDIWFDDVQSRPYSIASRCDQEKTIEVHVKKHGQGLVSRWLYNTVSTGQNLTLSKPVGDCFYNNDYAEKPLLLIGTGTGLAPLYGIAQEAIYQQHKAPVYIYWAVSSVADLYYLDDLHTLKKSTDKLHIFATVRHSDGLAEANLANSDQCSKDIIDSDIISLDNDRYKGDIMALVKEKHSDLKGWQVFLCGNPNMVKNSQRECFLLGAGASDIFTDAFTVKQH